MAKFKVIENVPTIQQWTHIVEADSEEQAIEMVQDGYADDFNAGYELFDAFTDPTYKAEKL